MKLFVTPRTVTQASIRVRMGVGVVFTRIGLGLLLSTLGATQHSERSILRPLC